MGVPLWRWSAADLAKAIQEKRLSSQEVIQAHLDRMEAVNGKVNAVTVVLSEEALRGAREADEAVAKGAALGPLHGVPMTVKENIDLLGSATTLGVVAFKNAMPPHDAPHISQLKEAGVIPIGRTNTPDFGLRWHTENELRGATRNPWDPSRTPGGSSGGDAVALATGMTPLGMGNDYGGSLRYPAQCCGITAIRPTLGRVPRIAPSLAPAELSLTVQLFAVHGPMARHVRDLRLALDAMSGSDPRDPWWTPALRLGSAPSGSIKVALTADPGGQGVDPAVAAGVKRAADALSEAGYVIEEVDPPSVEEAADLYLQLVLTEIESMVLPQIQPVASSKAVTFLNHVLELVPKKDLLSYAEGLAERNRIARQWSQFLHEHFSLVLGPVSTLQPFKLGYDLAGRDQVGEIVSSMRLTVAVNLLGLPAVATPVQAVDGLPQAVQIIGPRYHEDLCLGAAEVIERKLGVLTPIEPLG